MPFDTVCFAAFVVFAAVVWALVPLSRVAGGAPPLRESWRTFLRTRGWKLRGIYLLMYFAHGTKKSFLALATAIVAGCAVAVSELCGLSAVEVVRVLLDRVAATIGSLLAVLSTLLTAST